MSAVESMENSAFEHLRPTSQPDAVVRWYGDEAVAWSTRAGHPTHLPNVAAVVYQMLDGTASVGEIIDDIHDVVGVPRPVATQQVRQILTLLDQGALLTESDGSLPSTGVDFDPFPAPHNY